MNNIERVVVSGFSLLIGINAIRTIIRGAMSSTESANDNAQYLERYVEYYAEQSIST